MKNKMIVHVNDVNSTQIIQQLITGSIIIYMKLLNVNFIFKER